MSGVPTFLQNGTVVITRTANGGFAICENKNDPVNVCAVFEDWAACDYYLQANYVNAVQAA